LVSFIDLVDIFLQVHKNIQLSCHLSVDLVFYSKQYLMDLRKGGDSLDLNIKGTIETHPKNP
jgi:hypothetical protein